MQKMILIFALVCAGPSVFAADETPVSLDPLTRQKIATGTRPWRPARFDDQRSALGWRPDAFAVPKGMEKQVQFWIDIYTKYTTQQGVIHDADDVDTVYEVVDFAAIERSGLPAGIREKLKQKAVDDAKARIVHRLEKTDPAGSLFNPDRLRFQLGQKDRMETAIFLSGRYLDQFEEIFREAGVPVELTRLVFVESSFNVLARSKVGASGLWQLMPGTVKPYRIVSPAVDGRNHPITATRVAAKVLASNFRVLGSWPLAVTGYNHGPSGVARLVKKTGTDNITELVKSERKGGTFGFASRNFYASFLAALEVERRALIYFPSAMWSKAFAASEFALPQQIKYADLLEWFDRDDARLQLMNPHLTWRTRKGYAIPRGTSILVPFGKYSQAMMSLGLGKRSRRTASTQ